MQCTREHEVSPKHHTTQGSMQELEHTKSYISFPHFGKSMYHWKSDSSFFSCKLHGLAWWKRFAGFTPAVARAAIVWQTPSLITEMLQARQKASVNCDPLTICFVIVLLSLTCSVRLCVYNHFYLTIVILAEKTYPSRIHGSRLMVYVDVCGVSFDARATVNYFQWNPPSSLGKNFRCISRAEVQTSASCKSSPTHAWQLVWFCRMDLLANFRHLPTSLRFHVGHVCVIWRACVQHGTTTLDTIWQIMRYHTMWHVTC